ncbi:MAG: DUF1292 domain-containing protein [Clostridia bacterium]|nr:MAG: DUF1292 domain-containing protein [Clostridia bacterium]
MPEENEDRLVVLVDEDDKEHEFVLLDSLELGGNNYVILVPVEELDGEAQEPEAVILKVGQDDDGDEVLLEIEDEEEWNRVARSWEDLLQEEE